MPELIPLRRVEGSTDEMSDEALLAACATGERAALGALFDRHHAPVRSFAARMLGPEDSDLEDVVQVTFETVQRSAGKFRGGAAVRTWILGVARNVVRHHLRRSRRIERTGLALVEEPTPPPRSPLDEAACREQARRLEAAIDGLSPKLREVFVLVYLEGISGTDAAAALGMREGAVWKRLHLARKQIRAEMGDLR